MNSSVPLGRVMPGRCQRGQPACHLPGGLGRRSERGNDGWAARGGSPQRRVAERLCNAHDPEEGVSVRGGVARLRRVAGDACASRVRSRPTLRPDVHPRSAQRQES